ncbi:hypothetical protein cyc_03121 [Cyclospora cayetanensis]|uniref:Transmembrane protein n=1 Tax=Cyclospora cayetanensis TaxID=88456 RepID=A0A1D3CZ39_9EIME|nr:hypothetical protein cyc_03121 [Cyclospora cayetanensis]
MITHFRFKPCCDAAPSDDPVPQSGGSIPYGLGDALLPMSLVTSSQTIEASMLADGLETPKGKPREKQAGRKHENRHAKRKVVGLGWMPQQRRSFYPPRQAICLLLLAIFAVMVVKTSNFIRSKRHEFLHPLGEKMYTGFKKSHLDKLDLQEHDTSEDSASRGDAEIDAYLTGGRSSDDSDEDRLFRTPLDEDSVIRGRYFFGGKGSNADSASLSGDGTRTPETTASPTATGPTQKLHIQLDRDDSIDSRRFYPAPQHITQANDEESKSPEQTFVDASKTFRAGARLTAKRHSKLEKYIEGERPKDVSSPETADSEETTGGEPVAKDEKGYRSSTTKHVSSDDTEEKGINKDKCQSETILSASAPIFLQPEFPVTKGYTRADRKLEMAAPLAQALEEAAGSDAANEFRELLTKQLFPKPSREYTTEYLSTTSIEITKQEFLLCAASAYDWRMKRQQAYARLRVMNRALTALKAYEEKGEALPLLLATLLEEQKMVFNMEKEEATLEATKVELEYLLAEESAALQILEDKAHDLAGQLAGASILRAFDATPAKFRAKGSLFKNAGSTMANLESIDSTGALFHLPEIAKTLVSAKTATYADEYAAYKQMELVVKIVRYRKEVNQAIQRIVYSQQQQMHGGDPEMFNFYTILDQIGVEQRTEAARRRSAESGEQAAATAGKLPPLPSWIVWIV